jgi:hypothetical protein
MQYQIFPEHNRDIAPYATFEERMGEPDVLHAALGYVVDYFRSLEEKLNRYIVDLTNMERRAAQILLAELPFRSKLSVLVTLVHERMPTRRFNAGDADPVEMLHVLVARCRKAEEYRNLALYSSWKGEPGFDDALVKTSYMTLTGDQLLDVADFICITEDELDEWFIDPTANEAQTAEPSGLGEASGAPRLAVVPEGRGQSQRDRSAGRTQLQIRCSPVHRDETTPS